MNWKKENGERDEKRLNARYPTLTRDSYVPWDVGEERMCHRWNTDATRIVKKTIRSLADKTFCTIPDTFNKSNSIFQTNTQNNLKVARRCVIGNYRIYRIYRIYLFSMQNSFFYYVYTVQSFEASCLMTGDCIQLMSKHVDKYTKYSRNRLWRHERDWICCVVINKCSSNRVVQCYGHQWLFNWCHRISDAIDEMSYKPMSL